jgi:hypothetical protein
MLAHGKHPPIPRLERRRGLVRGDPAYDRDMSMGGGTPDPDAFTLDRIGRGTLGRGGGTTLQRRQGDEWVVVGRYPDRVAASRALDDAIAGGGSPADHRLVTEDRRGVDRLVLVGTVLLAVIVAVSLWLLID